MLGLLAVQCIKGCDLGYKLLCSQWPGMLQSLNAIGIKIIHVFKRGKISMEAEIKEIPGK